MEVGDKVVHPVYGAGHITAIQPITWDGVPAAYYTFQRGRDGLTVRVPVDRADVIGVRRIVTGEQLEGLVAILQGPPAPLPFDKLERETYLSARLLSGSAEVISLVLRDLAGERRRQRKLNQADMGHFNRAKQLLEGEWALVQDIRPETAGERINELLNALDES